MKFTKSGFGKLASIFGMFAIVVASFAFALSSAKAAEYDYAWAGQSDWPTISQGGSATVTLSLKNTGTAAWTNSGSNPMHLAAINPQDRNCGFFKSGEWLTANRAASLNESSVAPGEIGTFTFTVVGNPAPGTYPEYFAPVIENLTWMDNFSATPHGKYGIYWNITVTPGAGTSGYNAELISKSTDPTVAAGDSATLTVTVKNTGTATWSNTGANPMHLGTWNPQDRSSDFYDATWLSTNRPTGLTEASVAPGAQGTFTFTVKVPSSKANGTYTETFNLVTENLGWLNLPISFPITVSGTSTGDVTISLASDTPRGETLPQGATGVAMTKFKLIGTGTISSLKVHRFGVGSTDAIDNVYLYEGDKRLTNGRSVSSSSQMVEFNNLNYSVSGTEYLTVVADFVNGKQGQHGFEILSASDVSLSSVSGSFPIKGQLFAIGDEESSQVTISKRTNPSNPNVGEKADLAKFKIENGANDTKLYRVSLVQVGDISNTDLSDLELWNDNNNEKIAEAESLDGDNINFVLDTPFEMPENSTRLFTVKGTTSGRSGRSVQMYLEYTTDMLIIDQQYGYGARIENLYDGNDALDYYSYVVLQGGDITVNFSGPTTGDITKNGKDQNMMNFAISTASRDIEVRKLKIRLEGQGGADLYDGTTYFFDDVTIRETDSGYVASTQSAGDKVMGPKSLSSCNWTSNYDVCELTYNESFEINGGETRYFKVTWDVANESGTPPVNNSYRATLIGFDASSIRYADTSQYVPTSDIVPSSDHAANWQTVKDSTLDVSLGSVTSQTYVKGQSDVKAVAFNFATGNDAVRIDSVQFNGYIDADGTSDFGQKTDTDATGTRTVKNVVSQAKLMVNGTQIGGNETVDDNGRLTFDNLNWNIARDSGAEAILYINIQTSAFYDGNPERLYFDIVDASNDVSATNTDGDSIEATGDAKNGAPTVVVTVQDLGVIAGSVDGNTPDSDILVAGSSKVSVAKYRYTAQREGFQIQKFGVTLGNAGAGDAVGIGNVYIKYGSTEKAATKKSLTATGENYAYWTWSSDYPTVPKDGDLTVEILVDLVSITATNPEASDTQIKVVAKDTITIDAVATNTFKAVGLASGTEDITMGDLTANVMDVRKTKPVVTKKTIGTTTLVNANQTVYSFTVSNNSAGPIDFGKLRWNGTYSGATVINNCTLYDVTSSETVAGPTAAAQAGGLFTLDMALNPRKEIGGIGVGSTREYELRCTVAGAVGGDTVSFFLQNDGAHQDKGTFAAMPAGSNLVWSDHSIFGHTTASADYTNGYLIKLPTGSETLTKPT
ncbi:MAG: hypothetical protein ACOZAR_00810 [Patescibacteria group bacterium]